MHGSTHIGRLNKQPDRTTHSPGPDLNIFEPRCSRCRLCRLLFRIFLLQPHNRLRTSCRLSHCRRQYISPKRRRISGNPFRTGKPPFRRSPVHRLWPHSAHNLNRISYRLYHCCTLNSSKNSQSRRGFPYTAVRNMLPFHNTLPKNRH